VWEDSMILSMFYYIIFNINYFFLYVFHLFHNMFDQICDTIMSVNIIMNNWRNSRSIAEKIKHAMLKYNLGWMITWKYHKIIYRIQEKYSFYYNFIICPLYDNMKSVILILAIKLDQLISLKFYWNFTEKCFKTISVQFQWSFNEISAKFFHQSCICI